MTWRPRTATSMATSRPSTQGTVDYGFSSHMYPNATLDYDAAAAVGDSSIDNPYKKNTENQLIEESKTTPATTRR